jgi:hypothetical protein
VTFDVVAVVFYVDHVHVDCPDYVTEALYERLRAVAAVAAGQNAVNAPHNVLTDARVGSSRL